MKFLIATILLFIATVFGVDTVGFMVILDDEYYGAMACLPHEEIQKAFLYLCGDFNFKSFLLPVLDESTGLTVLASTQDPTKFVNIDSDGYLTLADTGYGFNETFEHPNLDKMTIAGTDTFHIVHLDGSGDDETFKIKITGDIPEGSTPINLGAIGVQTIIKRTKIGKEVHFNKFFKAK